ncbi:MAG: hypothetical protein D8M58_04500 [Calditrichaeota bacterium]|nr:MAG: hypothetical protein DWQ03_02575 [Calditrichota bacterium]MBL1204631.1 hypothetical protein [Calditrichota bacterium]
MRQKALELNLAPENTIKKWTDNKLYSVIFTHGLSTNPSPDRISGRGIGLDIVKKKTDEYGGTITICSEEGQFCEFIICLPIK